MLPGTATARLSINPTLYPFDNRTNLLGVLYEAGALLPGVSPFLSIVPRPPQLSRTRPNAGSTALPPRSRASIGVLGIRLVLTLMSLGPRLF